MDTWLAIFILCLFIVNAFLLCKFMINMINSRKSETKMEMPKPNNEAVLLRKSELNAKAAIGLMNLSGLKAPADELCGIYLLNGKVLFEAREESRELPFKRLKCVFTDKQTDVMRDNTRKKNTDFFRAFILTARPTPIAVAGVGLSMLRPPQEDLIHTMEISLVFEYIKDNGSTDYIVFAVGNSQFDDVKNFIKLYEEHTAGRRLAN